jgi:DNA-binding NarL/FixJ family response regulator
MPSGDGNVMEVFVVDPHSIYRRGLAASLELLDGVGAVAHAGSIREAWSHEELLSADVVLVDVAVEGGMDFVSAAAETTPAKVVVCTSPVTEEVVMASVQAGAVGVISKDTLNPEALGAAVKAAASGTGVIAPDLLASLLRSIGADGLDGPHAPARLNEREQQVLALIAAGHPTREVAEQLCYSERTVKNILHDVVTKLNARSRSQAVAFAVREGLI